MTLTVEIPDYVAEAIATEGKDPARAVLESVALEDYRADRLSEYEVQQVLGFGYFEEVHAFLKKNGVYLHYSMADLEHDLREADRNPS